VEDVAGEAVYAHTSPVYVVVGGRPAGSAEDACYFLRWLDRLAITAPERDRVAGPEGHALLRKKFDAARRVYQQIVDQEAHP